MKGKVSTLALLFVLAGPGAGLASQEGAVVWSSFEIHSAGVGDSGPVAISGSCDDTGVRQLTVKAFGRDFVLPESQLKDLKGTSINGMHLSYEGGYRELGGRTLYVTLSTGFTSGIRVATRVTFTEDGAVTITASR